MTVKKQETIQLSEMLSLTNVSMLYTWLKYADDEKGTGMSDEPIGKKYIGLAYNKTTMKESSDPKDYKWSKIQGEDGKSFTIKGRYETYEELIKEHPTGKEGDAYIVGENIYAWIVSPSGEGSWVDLGKIKGEDGAPGITLYTWIKYADDDHGTGMSDNPQGKQYIGIAYNKTTQKEELDYRLYTWSKIQASDFVIEGTLNSTDDLPPKGEVGHSYIINGELWTWKVDPMTGIGSWANMGQFIGGSTVMADKDPESFIWSVIQGWIGKNKTWSNIRNWNKVVKGDVLIVPVKVSDKDNCICHVYCDVIEQPKDSNIKTLVKSAQIGPQGPQGQPGLQGLQGPQGLDGIPGKNGIDGVSSYFHIKYSHKPNPTVSSDMIEVPAEYIGTYVDNTKEDSKDPKKYAWHRLEGAQGPKGEQGIPGKDGLSGKTTYLHIKYSNDGGKSFTTRNGEDVGKYIGVYTDNNKEDSSYPGDYTWSLIKGNSVIMAETSDRTYTWSQVEGMIGTTTQWSSIYNWMSMDKGDMIIIPVKISDRKYAICHIYCEVTQRPTSTLVYAKVISAQMGPEGPQGPQGPEGPVLDWVQDWDSGKTTIGGEKVLTPKIFAGRLDNIYENGAYVKKPTGVAMGERCFGTLNGFQNMAGICAYDKGKQTFSIDTEGQVYFGDPSGYNGLITYKNGRLSITAPSITLGSSDLQQSLDEKVNTGAYNSDKSGMDNRIDTANKTANSANSKVNNLESRVSSAEQKITPTSIVNSVSSAINNGGKLNTTSTVLDKNGLTVYNGGFSIVNNNRQKVLYGDAQGNLTLSGSITSYATITGGRLHSTNKDMEFDLNSGRIYNYNGGDYIGELGKNKIKNTTLHGISIAGDHDNYAAICCKQDVGGDYILGILVAGKDLYPGNDTYSKGINVLQNIDMHSWRMYNCNTLNFPSGDLTNSILGRMTGDRLGLYGDEGVPIGHVQSGKYITMFEVGTSVIDVWTNINMHGYRLNSLSLEASDLKVAKDIPNELRANTEVEQVVYDVVKCPEDTTVYADSIILEENRETYIGIKEGIIYDSFIVNITPIGVDRKVEIVKEDESGFYLKGNKGKVNYTVHAIDSITPSLYKQKNKETYGKVDEVVDILTEDTIGVNV